MIPAERLKNWVILKYEGQLIKRTAEPYFNHVLAVAEQAKDVVDWGYEIGLCHDLLEDTDTTADELLEALLNFDYEDSAANFITSCVVELTDVFTVAAHPYLSKKKRKKRESARLLTISSAAQTVKYADLIYNIGWVLKYDQKHAKKYLEKKGVLLTGLTRGEEGLHKQAISAVHRGLSMG